MSTSYWPMLRHGRLVPVLAALLLASACSARPRAVADYAAAGVITTVAGTGEAGCAERGGPAARARLNRPMGVAALADGTLYVPDYSCHRVYKVDPKGWLSIVAGDGWTDARGAGRFAGDGGPGVKASLNSPVSVAVGRDGCLYICDKFNQRIRKLDRAGIITTVAGDGREGYEGDGGPAVKARFRGPRCVAVGPDGSLYIADAGNHRIRKVDGRGVITTVAGDGWSVGGAYTGGRFSGDGGPATQASLNLPQTVAVGRDGSLYIADSMNHRIRKVDPKGIITTVAGDGWSGGAGATSYGGRFAGDGGPATEASLNCPVGISVGAEGSLFVTDFGNNRVRRIDPAGIISTVAGDGQAGYSGDGGPSIEASLGGCNGLTAGAGGALYIADTSNHRVRRVTWGRR